MSNIRSATRTALVENAQANNTANIGQLFDLYLQNDKAVVESTLRAITSADVVCPAVPTCGGIIDASYSCANGIETYVKIINKDCCPKQIAIINKNPIAVPLPANRQFGDQSDDLKGGTCVTINPQYVYSRYLIDNTICDNACGTGGVGGLISLATTYLNKAVLNATRKKIYDTAIAQAGLVTTTTGDLADRLIAVYSKVADSSVNDGKKIVVMANRSVINRLMLLRNSIGNFIYTDKKECPITGCLNICFYGIQVVEMDKTIMPNTVVNATTTTAEMIALSIENVFVSKSETTVKSKSWEATLVDTFDVIMAISCVDAVIPPAFTGGTRVTSARTVVSLNFA
jgi:hypothetical protein